MGFGIFALEFTIYGSARVRVYVRVRVRFRLFFQVLGFGDKDLSCNIYGIVFNVWGLVF